MKKYIGFILGLVMGVICTGLCEFVIICLVDVLIRHII